METAALKDLKEQAHIHLMGICGTAMASLAGLLQERGFRITGSEANPYPPMSTQIAGLGIAISTPYAAKNLHPTPDFVIVGNVISANNPEAQELLRLKIPYTSLPKALGELIIAERQALVVAGTHGKTTTTALLAHVATLQGLQPGFLIGGVAKNFARSFQTPLANHFIIEGDEYDTAFFDKQPKFVHYKPKHVILTSLEFDHADIYADLAAVQAAFTNLVKLIPPQGTLVYCAEDTHVVEVAQKTVAQKTQARKLSYGLSRGDYRAQILEVNERHTRFTVHHGDTVVGEFTTPLAGNYNILNCTAVVALAQALDWDRSRLKEAMASFQGVKRRQEILGEPGGVLVIEDFAHHPTAVRETLRGLRERYRSRKIFAVFEPRSATSRRRVFQQDYAVAFGEASEVLLMQAFDQSRIAEEERFSSEQLAEDIFRHGKPAKAYASVGEIVQALGQRAKAGDLIVVMSNGGFEGIYTQLLETLKRN